MNPTKKTLFKPIAPRATLVDQVCEQLRSKILLGEFRAGDELPPEGTLAEMLDVSRTVIREVMRILRAQGLVEVAQGRKPRVKPADPQAAVDSMTAMLRGGGNSVLQLMEVRRPLETAIAHHAALRATPEQIAAMQQAIEDQIGSIRREDQVAADMRFHALLAEATENPIFRMFMGTIWELLKTSIQTTLSKTGVDRAAVGHRKVLDAIEQHDAAAAEREMRAHLISAEEDLRA
ncbi:MAG TPA: FadR/GntR family transcriptional regulator [Planctomycetaceae bacterium]|nr:FadR/GntR family transcriptional regulator [Planctomycetaceae bacterium]